LNVEISDTKNVVKSLHIDMNILSAKALLWRHERL